MKTLFKIFFGFILFVLLLGAGIWVVIQQPKIQNWLVHKVSAQLTKKIGTTVNVESIKIDFLNHLNIEGVFIQDQKKDTLLYAGNLQFKITDWFFIKKEKPVISYLKLKDTYINLNRPFENNIWNYDFIAAAFGEKDNKDTTTKISVNKSITNEADTTMQFNLKEIELENVRFNSVDKWAGENIVLALAKLKIEANTINWKTKHIDLNYIAFDKTKFKYEDYKGGKPKKIKTVDTIDTTPFNPDNWKITLKEFIFDDGTFTYNYGFNPATPNVFDPDHIAVNNLNFHFDDALLIGDTITAHINKFKGDERCGFLIKSLTANAKINPTNTKLEQLLLVTNNSTIQDYYEMVYSRFPDFEDYIESVIMKCNFKNTNIAFKDIGYFAPEINNLTVKNALIEKGEGFGTVSNILAKNIKLKVGNSTLDGTLSMKGLPDIEETFIQLYANNLNTNGKDITSFIPAVKTNAVAWDGLTSINYKGSYKGYIRDFVTDGTLNTNHGSLYTNIHMKLPKESNKQPSYDGYFSTDGLKLGAIIPQKSIGAIAIKGVVNGSGFDMDNLNVKFNGDVNLIQTPTYTYKNIKINGALSNKKFDGKINANDPNIALDFDGKLDFSTTNPDFKLKTHLVKFNLKELGITNNDISGSAFMDLDFKGSTLDNFTGKVKLYKLNLDNKKQNIYLDSAILVSQPNGPNKFLNLKSSAADATINGQFKLADLYVGVQYYLSNYLPSYIPKPKNIQNQKFTYFVQTKNIEPLLKTFIPNISGCNNAEIAGSLDMYEKNLNLNVHAPFFAYDDYKIKEVRINSFGNAEKLNLNIDTENFAIGNNEIIPNANIETILGSDTALLTIKSAANNYNLKDATLQAKGYAKDNKLFLSILPSEFYYHENKWNLTSTDYVIFDKKTITADKLILNSGLQKIEIQTIGENNKNAKIDFTFLDINELAKSAKSKVDISGYANGTIYINDFLNQRVFSGNVNTSEIVYGKDTIGKLIAGLQFDEASKQIKIEENSGIIYKNNTTKFKGTIDAKQKDVLLNLSADINNLPVKLLENLFSDFISGTQGTANGYASITGPISKYELNGNLEIKDVSTKINYLGARYAIPTGNVVINSNKIDFKNIFIFDEFKNKSILKGNILHNNFDNISFNNLVIRSQDESFLFLKTTEAQNTLYYGTVFANGSVSFNGTPEDLEMNLIGETKKNTKLYLPISDGYDDNNYDFIKFKQYGNYEDSVNIVKSINNSNLELSITLNATPDAEVTMILDPTTGEEIKGVGNGAISMNIESGKPFSINGTYIVEKGNYVFGFRNLIRKDLKITPGGTIKWNGDPLKAILDLEAVYTTKTSLEPLVDLTVLTTDEQRTVRLAYQTDVKIKLSDEMLNPKIDYDIEQPANSDITSEAYRQLLALKANKLEVLTQIGALLFTGSFVKTKNTSTTNNNVANNFINTNTLLNNISGVVTNTLSNVITNNMNKILGLSNLNINVAYRNNGNGIDIYDQVAVKTSYKFNERLFVEVGNNVNYIRGDNARTTFNFLNDVNLYYLLTADGRYRINAFRTNFVDVLAATTSNGLNNGAFKNGVGLSYRKNGDKLFDIFKSISKINYSNSIYDEVSTEPSDSIKKKQQSKGGDE